MPNFILTRSSVILCPHGGIVTHIPMSGSCELINGDLPMLLNDQFFIAGCPFLGPMGPMPCLHVIWTNPSITKRINGVPVLTNASIGLAQAINSMPQGIVVIASFQTQVTD